MDIKKELIKFKNSKTVRKLKKHYKTPSLMEIYGINRKEIRHTSFLKWLFSDFTNSKESIKNLLDILITSDFCNKDEIFKSNEELINTLIINNYEINNVNINIPNSNKDNQVDIFISFKIDTFEINIIVENKVASNEHSKQTLKYYNELKKTDINIIQFFVYLTPKSSQQLSKLNGIPECACKKYIQINYQIILENILEPILKITKDYTEKSIIEDYIMALSVPYSNNTNHNFMAISTKETKLLRRFWKENQSLILKAIEATIENTNVEPELNKWAKEVSDKYKNIAIGKFVKNNLKKLFSDNVFNQDEINNLQEETYSKEVFNINYPLLKKYDNLKNKRYWTDKFTINGNDYRICSQWYEKNRMQFESWLNKWNN